MTISRKVADILLKAAERYLDSLSESERNQILNRTAKDWERPDTEQTTSATNS